MTTPISLPRTQRAIVANPQLDYSIREDAPLPPLIHDCIIIKTQYVGLNPVDTKMVGPFVGVGAGYGVSSTSPVEGPLQPFSTLAPHSLPCVQASQTLLSCILKGGLRGCCGSHWLCNSRRAFQHRRPRRWLRRWHGTASSLVWGFR